MNTSEAKYEPSRSRVDAVSENEHKRSLNLQIDQPENLTNTSEAKYESSRRHVDAVSENEHKRSMSLVVGMSMQLVKTSISEV